MSPKEYLFSLGITNDPGKSLFVKREDMQFDIAQVMEDYAKLSPAAKLIEVVSKSGTEYIIVGDNDSVAVCNTDSFGHTLVDGRPEAESDWPGALPIVIARNLASDSCLVQYPTP